MVPQVVSYNVVLNNFVVVEFILIHNLVIFPIQIMRNCFAQHLHFLSRNCVFILSKRFTVGHAPRITSQNEEFGVGNNRLSRFKAARPDSRVDGILGFMRILQPHHLVFQQVIDCACVLPIVPGRQSCRNFLIDIRIFGGRRRAGSSLEGERIAWAAICGPAHSVGVVVESSERELVDDRVWRPAILLP